MSEITVLQKENRRLRKELNTWRNKYDQLLAKILKLEKQAAHHRAKHLRQQQQRSTQEHKACGKKVTFPYRQMAESRAKKSGLRVYKCPYCDKWHMTSKNVTEVPDE